MAGSAKCDKNPKVIVEEIESDHSDEEEDESAEDAVDEVEIKEEVEDVDEFLSESPGLIGSSSENETEGEKLELVDEIKEEDLDGDTTSDNISEDSDVQLEDSEDERPKSKEKSKRKGEKRVTIMSEGSDEADDRESDGENEDEEKAEIKDEPDAEDSKCGLANVMAKILATPGGNSVMLSKARKDYEVNKIEDTGEFEFVDAEGNVKKEVKIEVKEEEDERERAHIKKRLKEALVKKLKLKPDLEADREKEKRLRIISTQGVVQLFTAIEKHKSNVQKERSKTKSIIAREKVSTDLKETFFNILEKEGEKAEKPLQRKKAKREAEDEPINLPAADKKPKWSVFADNFYKEPTLQGWDLESDEND